MSAAAPHPPAPFGARAPAPVGRRISDAPGVPPSPRSWGEGRGVGPARPARRGGDLDGYGGPIDLLLPLAREQKVDLGRISILALADQYPAFIARQRSLRLEIAGDYLVVAGR